MSPFKAFPHQPFHTPTARAPPNHRTEVWIRYQKSCIIARPPPIASSRSDLDFFFLSRTPSVRWFLFSKKVGNLPPKKNSGERLLGWRMRTWEWHDSDTPCHLAVSFDEVHRKAFAALQWAKVWSATMGLGAFFSSFEGDGLMMFDAKKMLRFESCIGEDIGCSQYAFFSGFNLWKFDVICCIKMAVMMWSCIYLDFFVGAEKPFSSVENSMLLSPPWRYTCSPPAIWHLAAETPGFCTPQRA